MGSRRKERVFDIFLTQYQGAILGPIAKVLGYILNGIYGFLSNFGIENAALCVVLFTVIVNVIMIPLTIKQQKWSKLSSKMSPELNKINNKYKGKKDEASLTAQRAETQALYEKYGTSPAGGCLPMLVSLPIMFALYKVIYAIPAYVTPISDLYTQIANITQGNQEAIDYLINNAKQLGVSTKGWGDNLPQMLAAAENTNYVVDILSKFGRGNWEPFMQFFNGTDLQTVKTVSNEVMHVNGFLGGLNIIESPMVHLFPGIIIPILSVLTQFLQTKMSMSTMTVDESNPTAASMKTMNNVMPFVSGMFCLWLPIGVGIYWVSSSCFRIVQQFFVNRYMDKVDVDEMIAKNAEKLEKKKQHSGNTNSVKNVAATRTNTIKEKAGAVTKKGNVKSDLNKEKISYEKGSIASIANMLGNAGEKSKGE